MSKSNYLIDANNMPVSQLKKKYALEYSSYKNMLGREKSQNAVISPLVRTFPNFLKHFGIRKDKHHTLDRINNYDPEYAPNKVRWANKKTQNNNRSNNVHLRHDDGRVKTVAEWASETNQKADTLYKRIKLGWAHMEIISGCRNKTPSIQEMPFPYHEKEEWENQYMSYVLRGYGGTKLMFLIAILERDIEPLLSKRKIYEILSYRVKGDMENYDEYVYYTYHQGYTELIENLQKNYNHISTVEELEESRERNEKEIERLNITLGEAKAMQAWIDHRKQCIARKAKSVSKSTIESYFRKLHPRPEYTVNQPDFMLDE